MTQAQTKTAYRFMLTERNGEQEYSHNYLVWAATQAEADRIAHDYASGWYDDGDERNKDLYSIDEDCFWFLGGCIAVDITSCVETNYDDFLQELIACHTVGKPLRILSAAKQLEIAMGILTEQQVTEYGDMCKLAETAVTIETNAITTIEQLKAMASADGGQECYILLEGGLRSSKHITYYAVDKKFKVENFIDDSVQILSEAEIIDPQRTHIGEAMLKGSLIAR